MPFICMLIIFQYQLSYILYTVRFRTLRVYIYNYNYYIYNLFIIMCSVVSDWLVFLIIAYLYPSTEVHRCVCLLVEHLKL